MIDRIAIQIVMPIIKLKETESFDAGLRRFKRSCDKAGVIAEVRRESSMKNLPQSENVRLQQP